MLIAKVIGPVVATEKHKCYASRKMLVVQPLDPHKLEPQGKSLVAFDAALAGVGDIVLLCKEGNAARQIFQDSSAPVNSVIVGIIDRVDIEE
jgi:microcompartment protein CcmK/EutM